MEPTKENQTTEQAVLDEDAIQSMTVFRQAMNVLDKIEDDKLTDKEKKEIAEKITTRVIIVKKNSFWGKLKDKVIERIKVILGIIGTGISIAAFNWAKDISEAIQHFVSK